MTTVYLNSKEKSRCLKLKEIQRLIAEGLNNREVARSVGASRDYVADVRHGKIGPPIMVDADPLVALFKAGMAVATIAKKVGINYGTAKFRLEEAGCVIPKRHKNITCKYSDSCFLCPMPDCMINDRVFEVNRLDLDEED